SSVTKRERSLTRSWSTTTTGCPTTSTTMAPASQGPWWPSSKSLPRESDLTMAAGELRQYAGAAAATTLAADITSASTSLSLTSGAGYPDGTVGPFFIVIDRGGTEEKVKCLSRTGNTITVVTTPSSGRGADNTVAA